MTVNNSERGKESGEREREREREREDVKRPGFHSSKLLDVFPTLGIILAEKFKFGASH